MRRDFSTGMLNQGLGTLRLKKHPAKTFIGRIEKGFDFLGYHFSPQGVTLAKQKTWPRLNGPYLA